MSDAQKNPSPDGLLDEAEVVDRVELGAGEDEGIGLEGGSFTRAMQALVTVAVLIGATYAVPALEWMQPWRADEDYVPFWNLIGREFMGQGAKAKALDDEQKKFEQLARDEQVEEPVKDREVVAPPPEVDRWPAYKAHEDDAQEVEREIEGVEQLDAFYAALARTDLGYEGAMTRVGQWGDSVIGNDGITSDVRVLLQRRFGDGGHGFHSLAKYDPSYKHKGVRFSEKGAQWSKCYIIRKCKKDGFYGYGGTTVWSAGGAESRFSSVEEGPVGRKFSTFEVWYAGKPKGGRLQLKIDKQEAVVLDTEAETYEDRWERFELEDTAHEVRVRAIGGGQVRAYGVVLEREGPGVVWDGMALIGSFTSRLLEQEQEHWSRQLQHRELNLIVYMFGGNDMGDGRKKKLDKYEATYRELIQRTKKARPEASCLIMAPIDHGERKGAKIVSKPIVAPMVEVQRKVALEEGCAFFDTFEAMGGEGSMGRWYKSTPRLTSGDFAHPTRAGRRVLGGMLYRALMKGYVDWRNAKTGTPMDEAAPEAEAATESD